MNEFKQNNANELEERTKNEIELIEDQEVAALSKDVLSETMAMIKANVENQADFYKRQLRYERIRTGILIFFSLVILGVVLYLTVYSVKKIDEVSYNLNRTINKIDNMVEDTEEFIEETKVFVNDTKDKITVTTDNIKDVTTDVKEKYEAINDSVESLNDSIKDFVDSINIFK